jgi:hypothetical protein
MVMMMMAGFLVADFTLFFVAMLMVTVYHRMRYILMQDLRHPSNPDRSSHEAGDHDTGRDFRAHTTVYKIFLGRW